MTKKLVVFLLSAGAGYFVLASFMKLRPAPAADARWVETHRSVEGLARAADAIVTGRVLSINQGRAVQEEDDSELQFSEVALGVDESLKGSAVGEELIVEVTGFHIDGIPDFNVGGRYLLFLKRQTESPYRWYVINNQAGFSLSKGLLKAADPADRVAATLDGRSLSVARVLVSESLRGR